MQRRRPIATHPRRRRPSIDSLLSSANHLPMTATTDSIAELFRAANEVGKLTAEEKRQAFRIFDINKSMVDHENNDIKKSAGRPATGKGKLIAVRLQDDLLCHLDAFASTAHPHPLNRSEAIRRILRERLTAPR